MTNEVDYGPLAAMIGTWVGDKGVDVAPDREDGTEKNLFIETIEISAVGDVDNADEQELAVVRYHTHVNRISDNKDIHDEVGYWLWDAKNETIMQSFTIPRGVCVLAGGKCENDGEGYILSVSASKDDPNWTFTQSPFMTKKAKTLSFENKVTIKGDELSYMEVTMVDIYGNSFRHSDKNTLKRKV